MKRKAFRKEKILEKEKLIPLGAGLCVFFRSSIEGIRAFLYRNDILIKSIDLNDNIKKKIFLVEAVMLGSQKKALANAFCMSRETIDSYLRIESEYGYAGLLHSKSKLSKLLKGKNNADNIIPVNKNKALAEKRKSEQEAIEGIQYEFNFSFSGEGEAKNIPEKDEPFNETHDWEETRYAGVFVYLMMLISSWKWLKLIMGYSGKFYKIFMVFFLMVARNFPSIEQLKNVHSREAGIILGITKLPSIPYVWRWFYGIANKKISISLLSDFFKFQIRSGIISTWCWFIDGHLLPYTGKEKVHHSYFTQRQMPYPGQTNLVSTDISGKIAHFDIQEGLGDLKGHILELSLELQSDFGESPIIVFDREGYGAEFFHNLITNNCTFVCWEKYIDKEKLEQIPDSDYVISFKFNDREYQIFEGEKQLSYVNSEGKTVTFTLRKIYIWNKQTNKRVCGLAWTNPKNVTSEECAQLILSRWGASENTFKHLGTRHPHHYRPGFALSESEKQDIANPELKKKNKEISNLNKKMNSINSKLAQSKPQLKKDGNPRRNSKYEKLKKERQKIVDKLKVCQLEKKNMPERIDLSTLEDYESFKKIDCEGKNLFDFVTASVWNARKKMVEFLIPYIRENERVDLFYAITNLHGKIKCTKSYVRVKLEPIQQTKRLEAQKQLCRFLTNNCPQLPNGKQLFIEVDENLI